MNSRVGRVGTDICAAPQQDILREYADKHAGTSDVAFELPTGTGKTAVGLLIAEWKRLSGNRVAYLSLTNQLAGQVVKGLCRTTQSGPESKRTQEGALIHAS